MNSRVAFIFFTLLFSITFLVDVYAQLNVKIEFDKPTTTVSPYIFGRNNSISQFSFGSISNEDFVRLKDAQVRIMRENGGNNSTKYNWRRKLQSHPDWYNNVYANDWGQQALIVQKNLPNAQTLFAFQLLGKAAKTNQNNFDDWGHNRSQWWEGVNQNLAGKGVLNSSGTKAKVEGDTELYLEDWNADSTTGILPYFFNTLGLDSNKLIYWNMDNEPEIWNGTHDDVIKSQIPAEEFVQRYIAVAKKARAAYPSIKLMGPVPANEWQWYNWGDNAITYKGKNYPWLEYFIKRIAEEQKSSGIKLLDIMDIHFYPGANADDQIVQLHRVFFDKNYIWPEANGVKRINGGWDPSQNKEYIFTRINDWLDLHLGQGHTVTLGMTETGINGNNPNVTAVWYATMLGEFMKQKVEVFTPWSWKIGMWETLHLFSRFSFNQYLPTTTADETKLTAYTTVTQKKDSLCIYLVNKTNTTIAVSIPLTMFPARSSATVYTLSNLPAQETFYSATQNALRKEMIIIHDDKVNLSVAPYAIVAVVINKEQITPTYDLHRNRIDIFPNPVQDIINIKSANVNITGLEILDIMGRIRMKKNINQSGIIQITHSLHEGLYWLKMRTSGNETFTRKIIIE